MAGLTALQDLLQSDLLRCPLCREQLQGAVLLPCLHSLCRDCAAGLGHSQQNDLGGATVRCPVCGTECLTKGPDGLQPNHFLRSLRELQQCQTQDGAKDCDYCQFDHQNVKAAARCLQCRDNLCQECAEAHQRTKLTRQHPVIPLREIEHGKYNRDIRFHQQLSCNSHSQESLSYYCNTCTRLICRECKIHEHHKHATAELRDACEGAKSQVDNLLSTANTKVPSLDKYLQFLDNYASTVAHQREKLQQDVEQQAQHLHALIDDHKLRILAGIEKACDEELTVIERKNATFTHLANMFGTTLSFVDQLMQHGKPEEILMVKPVLSTRLTELIYLKPDLLPTKLSAYFTSGPPAARNMEEVFGKFEAYHTPVEQLKGQEREQLSVPPPPPSSSVTKELSLVREFDCKSDSDVKDIWPTGLAINKDNEVIIVDRENKKVKVYDASGKYVREFGKAGRNQLGCPYDVTVLRDGNYAISDYEHECLKVFDGSGSHVQTIRANLKYPRGVCCTSTGHVVVVDCHNHRLTLINPETGYVEKTIDGRGQKDSEPLTDPYYVTENHKQQLIVTDWASPNVKVYDKEGRFVDTYGTYGVQGGRLLHPYGICVDDFGYVFVADSQNHSVHLLSPEGKFIGFLLTQQHGLWHPMALAIDRHGHLVVTEALGKVKVFKYL